MITSKLPIMIKESYVLKKFLVPALFFFCVLPAGASNVSFLVMEAGQGSLPAQYSTQWENGIFEVFFDVGHIVSNALKIQIYESPGDNLPDDAERDYIDAKEAGMDFFVVAIINYPERRGTAPVKPQNVTLRLFSTRSEQMIYEQVYTDTTTRNARDEYDSIKRALREFAAHINDNSAILFRR
jgi:hypothetical protein